MKKNNYEEEDFLIYMYTVDQGFFCLIFLPQVKTYNTCEVREGTCLNWHHNKDTIRTMKPFIQFPQCKIISYNYFLNMQNI